MLQITSSFEMMPSPLRSHRRNRPTTRSPLATRDARSCSVGLADFLAEVFVLAEVGEGLAIVDRCSIWKSLRRPAGSEAESRSRPDQGGNPHAVSIQSSCSHHAILMQPSCKPHAIIMQSSAGNGLEVKLWKKTGRVCLVPRIVRGHQWSSVAISGHQRSSVEADLSGPSRAVDLG
jgi:hypothetical protein